MSSELYSAARNGDIASLRKALKSLDVNWADSSGHNWTPLHYAASFGQSDIVEELLAHPQIDINKGSVTNSTPLLIACWHRSFATAELLCCDQRCEHDAPNHDGCSPTWAAVYRGHVPMVKLLMATARHIDLHRTGCGDEGDPPVSVSDMARDAPEMKALLVRYEADPTQTKRKLRKELGLPVPLGEQAAETYAAVVFLCDGLLRHSVRGPLEHHRFLWMAQRLPIELQMMLCNRAYGVANDGIPSTLSEPAFRDLAQLFV